MSQDSEMSHDDNTDEHSEPGQDSDTGHGSGPDSRRRVIPVWLVPLLIGVVTVTAGLFTWRAGQLGSSAAFEDRQSVGQTIQQQEQNVEVSLTAVNDAVAYVRYVADYAEAACARRHRGRVGGPTTGPVRRQLLR